MELPRASIAARRAACEADRLAVRERLAVAPAERCQHRVALAGGRVRGTVPAGTEAGG
jgi:hypothetical protein